MALIQFRPLLFGTLIVLAFWAGTMYGSQWQRSPSELLVDEGRLSAGSGAPFLAQTPTASAREAGAAPLAPSPGLKEEATVPTLRARSPSGPRSTSDESGRAVCPSLSSSALAHVNSEQPYRLVDASPEISGHGVVAASCKSAGWDYVLAMPRFDRRGEKWYGQLFNAVMGQMRPRRCGYDWREVIHNVYPRSPCDTVVDIGGNIGMSVMPGLARGWRTIVFEPVPRNVEVLRLNIFLNGWGEDLVNLLAAAASNITGQLEIFVPKGREDNTAMGSAKTATSNVGSKTETEVIPITTVKLDDYFAGADPGLRDSVRLVKIDTQGHELSVLQGMREFLSTGPRQFVVLVEMDMKLQKLAGHGPDDIPNFMAELGWKPYCPGKTALVPGRNCYDVLFKHD